MDDARLNVVPRDRLPLPDWFDPAAPVPPGPSGPASFPTDTLAMLYMSDAVELFVTADTARATRLRPQDYQIITDVRGAVGVLRGDVVLARLRPDWTQPKVVDRGVRVAAGARIRGTLNLNDDRDDGYTVELAVPWASLGLDAPSPGRTLHVLAAVDDNEEPLPPDFGGRPVADVRYDAVTHCGGRDYGPPATWSTVRLAAPTAPPTPWARWAWAVAVALGLIGAGWSVRRRRASAPDLTEAAESPSAMPPLADAASAPSGTAPPDTALSADARWLARVDAALAEGLGQPGFGVEVLAHEVGISPRQFQRRLSAQTGQTPVDYLRRARLARAAELLDARVGTVAEVAARVGIDPASLSRQFRAHYGVAPSAWSQRDRESGE